MSARVVFRAVPGNLSRASGDGARLIVGHASVFDTWTTIYETEDFQEREIVRPGAFREALAANQDVRALRDHNPTLLLGRTRSGTLRLREDDRGLAVEIDPPDTEIGRDTLHLLDRGDLSGMSIAFWPRDGGEVIHYRRQDGVFIYEREVLSVDLYDVSVVTYPAFPSTDVHARSRDLAASVARRAEALARNQSTLSALSAKRRALALEALKLKKGE